MTAARRVLTMLAGIGATLVIATLAGCTAVAQPASEDGATVGTVGAVGQLPQTFPVTDSAAPDTEPAATETAAVTDPSTTSSLPPTSTTAPQIGTLAEGNRVIMIGDSITASISHRYGDEACKALVPLGWKVEVDAEVGRSIDFAKLVLDKRLDAGWDAAIIFLGTNYGDKKDVYQSYLHNILLRLVPRPTVVITSGLFRPQQQEVNDAIREEAAQFKSVTVLDWAKIAEDPSLTGGDNIHLTESGRRALAYALAVTMGNAPDQPGDCLDTKYKDDSAGSPYGPPGNTTTTKTTVARPTSTSTASTASTTPGNSTATTKPTGSTTVTVPTSTSSAPTPTTPPPTAPPTTPAPVITTPVVTVPQTQPTTGPTLKP